ncbi:MAG: VWA domain-containing protein [Dehalococcoidia bacterium]|nr:VWA domain-containing protein [Dehalococcoidia bacterium]
MPSYSGESYRYSGWNGEQDLLQLDHEDIMAELSDYLLAQGDVQSALKQMMQRGMRNQPMLGLQELLQRLRNKRQQTLDQYNLNSAVNEIKEKLDQILETERAGIQRRQEAAGQRSQEIRERYEARSAEGEDSASTVDGDGLDPTSAQRLADFVDQMAAQKREFLGGLPEEAGSALHALAQYDFVDTEAKRLYDELMEQLRQQVAQNLFQQMTQGLQNGPDPERAEQMKDMLEQLNDLLQQKLAGQDTSGEFEQFLQQWQKQMGADAPASLEQLLGSIRDRVQQMQSLMESLSGEQRQELDNLMQNVFKDMGLQQEMEKLYDALSQLFPNEQAQRYPFRGEEGVDLQEAMALLQQLGKIEELEKQLRKAQYGEGVDQLDPDAMRELLGEEEAQSLDALKNLSKELEAAGYIRSDGDRMELTPRGMRLIGQKALKDIFDRLKQDRFGNHATKRTGSGIERFEEAKPYEFGDPFFLDLHQTVRNAIERGGPGLPVSLDPKDFEVFRTEKQTQSSTVLMLDLSWSMARRGSFYAAKKVILALHNLIRTQFPRDAIYIVGFSTYARELKADQLPYITWDQAEPYTNMQQGLIISQQLLARHKASTKQILMISDGEPTAHVERGQVYLGYPPSPRTITETLREVRRCTRDGIVINVFMLDKSYYLKEFVDQLTKINRGRAFYTSPETLGQYVMVDYLTGKKRRIA